MSERWKQQTVAETAAAESRSMLMRAGCVVDKARHWTLGVERLAEREGDSTSR